MSKKRLQDKVLDHYTGQRGDNIPQPLIFEHFAPATRLLEKRRQMFEVQEALNSQKEEFGRREDAYRRREDGLRKKDLELQESLIKFNRFLQENEQKCKRALKRAADEKKQREGKEIEIKRLEALFLNTVKEERLLKGELEKNRKYQDFLEQVVSYNMGEFFQEVPDILSRYKTLRDANSYLSEKQGVEELANANMERDFTIFKKSKENYVLSVSNDIADMQDKLWKSQAENSSLLVAVDQARLEVSRKKIDENKMLKSISNIHERCVAAFRVRHNKPRYERLSEETGICQVIKSSIRKLDEIAMHIVDLSDIHEKWNSLDAASKRNHSGALGATATIGVGTSASTMQTSMAASASSPAIVVSKNNHSI